MNGLAIVLLVLVIPGCDRDPTLDKTGTIELPIGVVGAETLGKQEPAGAGSFSAEREGFSDRGPVAHPVQWQLLVF